MGDTKSKDECLPKKYKQIAESDLGNILNKGKTIYYKSKYGECIKLGKYNETLEIGDDDISFGPAQLVTTKKQFFKDGDEETYMYMI
jgi:hypothetical protein